MFGLTIAEVSTLFSLFVITVTQIIFIFTGKFSDVTKLEQKKQQVLNKLYKKADKTKEKLSAQVAKIESLENSKKNNSDEVK